MKSGRSIVQWVVLFLLASKALASSPVIDTFTPAVGWSGDQVMLTGSGFTSGGITVYFWNGKPATIIYISSDTQMTVSVPSGITTGPVGIQQGIGTIAYTAADFIATGPGPYITDFSPGYGAANDLISIDGAHLTNSPVVKFNGTTSTSVSVTADGTHATARVPAGATTGRLTVTTSLGTSTNVNSFVVVGPGPYITGFSPVGGSSGLQVTVTGVHFTGATNATFAGQPGVSFAATSDTQLRVTTPSGVTSGAITVNSPTGSYSSVSNFYVPPTLSSFTPTTGRPGTNVTISGINFLGATSVTFNGLAAASYTVVNNTTIRATVPNGVTDGLIRINTPLYSCFSANNFGVQPTLYGFTPQLGPVGTSVTITGANFNAGTPSVKFNGVQAATPTGVSFGQLTAVVPAGATTGPITVTTTNGSAVSTSNFMLPAGIASFSPNAGPAGSRMTINGTNFLGTTGISFNGQPAPSFTVSNNLVIGAVIPSNIVTGPISVTTLVNTATSAAVFYGVPGLTNFSPTHGISGTVVTLSGTNLLGATAVRFNGVNATISSNSTYFITASVPAGAQTGPISVVGPGGTNTTSANFVVDHPSDTAIWGSASANPATLGSNLVYTISIVNNGPNNAPTVMVTNTLPASVTLKSATINQGTLNTNGNPIIGTLGTMLSGAAVTLQITVVPRAVGTITNVMAVGSGNPDQIPGNNTSTIQTFVQSPAVLSIQLLPNLVKVSWPGDLTNYALQARNTLATNIYWSNVVTAPISASNQLSVIEALSNATRYYRLLH